MLDDVAKQTSASTRGLLPYHVAQTMLHQLTRYLSGNDYCAGMQIPDLVTTFDMHIVSRNFYLILSQQGDSHWALRLARVSGQVTSAVVHYVPLGEKTIRHVTIAATRRAIEAREKHHKLGSAIRVAPSGLPSSL